MTQFATNETYDVRLGDVFRDKHPDGYAFSDMIVVKINDDGTANLERPYAYTDPLSHRVAISTEPLKRFRFESLLDNYTRVCRGRVLAQHSLDPPAPVPCTCATKGTPTCKVHGPRAVSVRGDRDGYKLDTKNYEGTPFGLGSE